MIPARPIWQSKSVWFNILVTALDLLALSDVVAALPPEALPYVSLIQLVGNILLRRITAGPVTWTTPPER